MGKIIKKPKAPKVIVQQAPEPEKDTGNEDDVVERQRRARAEKEDEQKGRESLVNTSLRGVLNDVNDYRPLRKTLLGE